MELYERKDDSTENEQRDSQSDSKDQAIHALPPCRAQLQVHAGCEDGRHPEADEQTSFLVGRAEDAEPQ